MTNDSLPIAVFRDKIVETVAGNPVVIITAETGAGKSTQVPQYLLDEGYNVVVTEPLRLAAQNVSKRVAGEYGCELGSTVGYRISGERKDSDETRCLFCTDGLALVRELMGAGQHDILVLDEVHEWNLNMEVLVAWAKHQIEQGVDFRVVVMSATLEAEKLSSFFDNAPIISVPGRLFPVEEREPGDKLDDDVADLLRAGRNVLVFQPGKKEIADTVTAMEAIPGLNAEIVPLHGGLTSAEQDRAFRHYARPKCVVATNVAQTSITIDDIDAVVDSGKERRIELVSGVEGLYLKPISLADREQRKGRGARTKPGIYIDHCRSSDRLDFPVAEIMRTRLDQTVLRLARFEIDAAELEFFHQPPHDQIEDAKRALVALGCIEEDLTVTTTGERVSLLPVSVQFGRMIVEAEERGVVDDVVTVAAILEEGGVTARKIKRNGVDINGISVWKPKFCPDEHSSDVMAQLAVYVGASILSKRERYDAAVHTKAYENVENKRRLLVNALRGKVELSSTGEREDILKSVCAGMVDHLFQDSGWGRYTNGSTTERKLGNESVVSGADWLVGLPFDLEVKAKKGGTLTLRLITMATKVEPDWLCEVAPQLSHVEDGNFRYSTAVSNVVQVRETYFNGQLVSEQEAPAWCCPEAITTLATALANGEIEYADRVHNESVVAAISKLSRTYPGEVHSITTEFLVDRFRQELGRVYSVDCLDKVNLRLEATEFASEEYLENVEIPIPETITHDGVEMVVSYRDASHFSSTVRIMATARIRVEHVMNFESLPVFPKAQSEEYHIIDANGAVIDKVTYGGLGTLRSKAEKYNAEAHMRKAREEIEEHMDSLHNRCSEMEEHGVPVPHLRNLMREARASIDGMDRWYNPVSAQTVMSKLNQVEAEIERVTSDGPKAVLEDLLAGRLHHHNVSANKRTLEELAILAIRSGGFIEAPSEEEVKMFYEERLAGISDWDELAYCDLAIRFEDYAPADILEELEADGQLAPDMAQIEVRKRTKHYPIRYGYAQIEDERVVVAIIKMSLKNYESGVSLPALPHGIRLVLELTHDDKVVVSGEENEKLWAKIKKFKKAKNRSKHADRGGALDHDSPFLLNLFR